MAVSEKKTKEIYRVNGPVVKARGRGDFAMQSVVLVGEERLIGEVIRIDGEEATIQVYETTGGLKPGEPVVTTEKPLSVTLGPGIIGNIFDGIQRPLKALEEKSGAFMARGLNISNLDTEKLWHFKPVAKVGDSVGVLSIVGEVRETGSIVNRIMIPESAFSEYSRKTRSKVQGAFEHRGVMGVIKSIASEGEYTVKDTIAVVEFPDGTESSVCMMQEWPVRRARPVQKRLPVDEPLVTGQRIIDSLFPIARGGTAAVPGSFGTGKTMTQHQLAQWCDADIIIYIGCGERGNEMTEVLEDFPKLNDPRTGRSLMERTVLIANTSNMPVAAREASVYTGITLAEYYRDMGYDVAIMADSTSRWAEALREISGRLEEMPAEEGFPAYLASRLSEFYGRAGRTLSLNGKTGSVSVIGAVSPQGGDFSEPVTQNTKRFVRCFWGLDRSLAYARHYPAIHWLTSYSEYSEDLEKWYAEHLDKEFIERRDRTMLILEKENELMEIAKLVGTDVLPEDQKLALEIARVIRVGFLQQNAFHPVDTYVPLEKQSSMMGLILFLYDKAAELIKQGIPLSAVATTGFFEECIQMKYTVPNDDLSVIKEMKRRFDEELRKMMREYNAHRGVQL